MIRTILILSLALIASGGANLLQWRGAAVARAEHQAAIDAAVQRGRTEAAELAVSRMAGIALLRVTDDLELLRLRQQVAAGQAKARVVYQDRIRYVDRPVCSASAVQVTAVNEVLQ